MTGGIFINKLLNRCFLQDHNSFTLVDGKQSDGPCFTLRGEFRKCEKSFLQGIITWMDWVLMRFTLLIDNCPLDQAQGVCFASRSAKDTDETSLNATEDLDIDGFNTRAEIKVVLLSQYWYVLAPYLLYILPERTSKSHLKRSWHKEPRKERQMCYEKQSRRRESIFRQCNLWPDTSRFDGFCQHEQIKADRKTTQEEKTRLHDDKIFLLGIRFIRLIVMHLQGQLHAGR